MFDTNSAAWIAVKKSLLTMIEVEHTRLESISLTEPETNYSRGQIAAARKVLDTFEPTEPSVAVESDTYEL